MNKPLWSPWFVQKYLSVLMIKATLNASCLLGKRRWCHLIGTDDGLRRESNDGSMLGQHLRRWPSIDPSLDEHIVFVGVSH